jgi:hypothetical protein
MQFLLTKFPFFAVTNSGLFRNLSASEIVVVFYGTLKLMWLKFLLLWRFFRLWALLDRFDVPENMKVRCRCTRTAGYNVFSIFIASTEMYVQ